MIEVSNVFDECGFRMQVMTLLYCIKPVAEVFYWLSAPFVSIKFNVFNLWNSKLGHDETQVFNAVEIGQVQYRI